MGELVKVRLLNGGGYPSMRGVEFPCFVMAEIKKADGCGWYLAHPTNESLSSAGRINSSGALAFYVGTECEIIND